MHVRIVNARDDGAAENEACTVVLSGKPVQVSLAYDALEMLLTMSLHKKIVNKSEGKIQVL